MRILSLVRGSLSSLPWVLMAESRPARRLARLALAVTWGRVLLYPQLS